MTDDFDHDGTAATISSLKNTHGIVRTTEKTMKTKKTNDPMTVPPPSTPACLNCGLPVSAHAFGCQIADVQWKAVQPPGETPEYIAKDEGLGLPARRQVKDWIKR